MAQTTPELADLYLMQTGRRLPVTFVRGRGCVLFDEAGREYLDLVAGIAVNLLGHAHPDVVAAVGKQAGQLIHTSNLYFTQPQVERDCVWLQLARHGQRAGAGGRNHTFESSLVSGIQEDCRKVGVILHDQHEHSPAPAGHLA